MGTNAVRSSRRNRKLSAIAAGALVVGLGATYTLASWTDSEWVFGGGAGSGENGGGVGTETFEVQQKVTGDADFTDRETIGEAGALGFAPGALALSPGDSVFAPVSLKTTADSIAGDVQLQGAVQGQDAAGALLGTDGPTDLLWNAIQVDVFTSNAATAPACSATEVATAAWSPIVTAAPLGTDGTGPQTLAAAGASQQHYCFQLTLPASATDNALMGRTIAPAWEFAATSN